MVPWEQEKYLVWDATSVDTFCQSHCQRAATEPGGAAAHAEEDKTKKYAHLDRMYQFHPVVLETCGTIGPKSRDHLGPCRHMFVTGCMRENPILHPMTLRAVL